MAGAAIAAAIGSNRATAQTTVGYGEGGYGNSPYGGSEPEPGVPAIDSFGVFPSDDLGDDRMVSVKWGVSDTEGDLESVEVVVDDGSYNLNFSVSDVSGGSASGWDLFQFPIGTELNVNLKVTDMAGNSTKQRKTVTL